MDLSSGGPTQSLANLCLSLQTMGIHAPIATLGKHPPIGLPTGLELHAFPTAPPHFLGRSPSLERFLTHTPSELIHAHGIWLWSTRHARLAAAKRQIPFVISPRGSLEPWCLNDKRHKKQLAWRLWEGANFRSAALLHATSMMEVNTLRNLGLRQPIALVPNGLEFPTPSQVKKGPRRRAIFLSRFHKKKGVDHLLRAWAETQPRFSDWDLWLAGPDEGGTRVDMEQLAQDLGITESVTFSGPIYGADKWSTLAASDLFILPSHSENFGNVVVEALSQGIPVLTTQGTPWLELEQQRAGWCIPLEGLPTALAGALALPRLELEAMGARGSRWAHAHFHASVTGALMKQAYLWLLGQSSRPSHIL